jgi:16S rRNA A1518/A1519 N6-dimethyltransferase RsmA/KsgA/DIM1 with predicted DNA glycosylase/AP lyase activity
VDLGAGTGHVTRDLLSIFTHDSAIELDSDMARFLLKNTRLTIHIVRAEDAVVATASSDAIVSGSVGWMPTS